jgi:hypothetical protein
MMADADLPDAQRAAIFCGNAEALFGLGGAA